MRRQLLAGIGVLCVTSPLWAQVSASLSWVNPTAYEDGTQLPASAIDETRISFAPVSGGTPAVVEVAPGSVTTHATLPVFSAGTWYARAQTVAGGVVSDYSNEASFTVGVCQANPAACTPQPPSNLTAQ